MSGIVPLEPDCWVGKVADLLSHSRDAQVALVGEEAQHLLDKELMGPDEMAHRMTRIQKAAQAVADDQEDEDGEADGE